MFLAFPLTLVGLLWSSVVPAAVRTDFNRMMSIAERLKHDVPILLNTSVKCGTIHQEMPKNPEKTPCSSVTGNLFSEKLRDIYIKGQLFYFHMEEMGKHQKSLLDNLDCVSRIFTTVKETLQNLLLTLKKASQSVCPEMGELIPPDPPEFPKRGLFEKRRHGRVVMFRLKEWVENVTQVLEGHVRHSHGC